MTSDTRLADVVAELETVGISCLVMGGHAVRYYGLARNTNDADLPAATLHLALVEIVRRRYIAFRKDNDRRANEAIRAVQP